MIPSPSPLHRSLDFTADTESIRVAVSHARTTHRKYLTNNYHRWSETRFDDAVQEFVEWTVARLATNGVPKPPHAHCEVELLTYIYKNDLAVYPHFGSSKLCCETCKIIIRAHRSASTGLRPRKSSIPSNGKIHHQCSIPEFEGALGDKFREQVLCTLQKRLALTVIARIDQFPARHYYMSGELKGFPHTSPLSVSIAA